MSEVENELVIKDLIENYSNRKYNYIHYDSPDERGIDNVLLYDKNKLEIISDRPIRNNLPDGDKTRDILSKKMKLIWKKRKEETNVTKKSNA